MCHSYFPDSIGLDIFVTSVWMCFVKALRNWCPSPNTTGLFAKGGGTTEGGGGYDNDRKVEHDSTFP